MKWPLLYTKEKWDGIIYVQGWNDMIWLNCPLPTILTVPQDMRRYNHYLQIKMTFLVASECVQVEEWFATRGTHQPHPRFTLHTCTQMVAHEVNGPSLQPSTWHLYTHLTPPIEYEGAACQWGELPLKLVKLPMHVLSFVLQTQRLQVWHL